MAFQPLFRLGDVSGSAGSAAGFRGLFGFWLGGASATPPVTVPVGGPIGRELPDWLLARWIKRKREIDRALAELQKRSFEQPPPAQVQIDLDIQVIEAAIHEAEAANDLAQISRIARLVEGAASAEKMSVMLKKANQAAKVATSLLEDADDEEAIMALLQ